MTDEYFLLVEDAAIKNKLSGITVYDGTDQIRPVDVRFRMPETELANATFPLIVINPAGMTKADDREHRGIINLPYYPNTFPQNTTAHTVDEDGHMVDFDPSEDVTNSPFINDYPIPFNFDYNVTVYTRNQQHMVQLIQALSTQTYLPPRFGWIIVGNGTNSTVRSLDVLGGPAPAPDRDSDGKRIFRTEYIVRVFSELTPQKYTQVVGPGQEPDEGDVTGVVRIGEVDVAVDDFTDQGWQV